MVNTGVTPNDTLSGAQATGQGHDGEGHDVEAGRRRIAYCECGAQLAGDSRLALLHAAESHVAHHHPELVGAFELDVLMQMAEDVGGTDADGRPGA